MTFLTVTSNQYRDRKHAVVGSIDAAGYRAGVAIFIRMKHKYWVR